MNEEKCSRTFTKRYKFKRDWYVRKICISIDTLFFVLIETSEDKYNQHIYLFEIYNLFANKQISKTIGTSLVSNKISSILLSIFRKLFRQINARN